MTKKSMQQKSYYVLTCEWLYPTESGVDVPNQVIFFDHDSAVQYAKELCLKEMRNFMEVTGIDPTMPNHYTYGDSEIVDIVPKNGLEDWFYAIRINEVMSI